MLVADCVGKRYGSRQVLSAATLRAVPRQLRALVGRNGVGKTTLLRIACGLSRADTGIIRIGGTVVGRPSLHRLARVGAFFLPEYDLLFGGFTLREQFGIITRMAGQDAAAIRGVAALLGVEHVLDRRPAGLSGGELRRAEVAAAVLRKPRWLLADEPLRGIAPLDADVLLRAFRTLADDGSAVVITGHEVEALFDSVDHVTWCTNGTTYELGSAASARAHERFAREFLGRQSRLVADLRSREAQ